MTLLQIAVLAMIQGITEFLPVSSSGHLALTPVLFDWPDQGLIIDVAVHVGTLGAVIVYLWREITEILYGIGKLTVGRLDEGAKLAAFIIIASIPVFIAGLIIKIYVGDTLRTPLIIGWAFILGGVLLYLSDRFSFRIKRIAHITVGNALLIGIAQAFAIIPGASRAGTTITMARILGFERRDAARFSMLLSIPAIFGAGFIQGIDVFRSTDAAFQTNVLIAIGLAFVTALLAIIAMMNWLQRQNFTPFAIYRIALGIIILWLTT